MKKLPSVHEKLQNTHGKHLSYPLNCSANRGKSNGENFNFFNNPLNLYMPPVCAQYIEAYLEYVNSGQSDNPVLVEYENDII